MPSDQTTCACGRRFADDPFWRAVLDRAAIGTAELAELARLEASVCRTGYIARRGFSLDRLRAEPEVQAFLSLQIRLFAAVAGVSGKSVIVDSSKAGPRAWMLACDPRTRLLHLHRDPTDVLASWRSRKFDPGLGRNMRRPPIGSAAADWWKSDYLATRLSGETDVVFIDYAAFCSSPRTVVDEAALRFGLGATAGSWIDDCTFESGADYHSLNGNPDRFEAGAVQIRKRDVDWSGHSVGERMAIAVSGRMLAAFSGHGRR